jgi:hypothetical protein
VLNLLEFRVAGANDLLARSEAAGDATYWNLGIELKSSWNLGILESRPLDD